MLPQPQGKVTMGNAGPLGRWTGPAAFLFGAVVFGLAYCQAPLYYSNQNQYFLHGLADAGLGHLREDWLANTTDPTPVFNALVAATYRHLPEFTFHIYYLLLFGVYFAALMSLFGSLAGARSTPRLRLVFAALVLLVHSALVRWESYRVLGWDYPWYLQAGVAGQYVLGAMWQPSTFGVFLVLAIALFVRGRPYWAAVSAALAATVHSTYLLGAGVLTAGFMAALWRAGRGREALRLGAWALVLVLPALAYGLVTFRPTSADVFAEAQHILVHVRIPHHCIPRLWCDHIAVGQIAWVLLAVALTWRTRLFPVLGVAVLLAAGLTLIQVATANDTLALLFPWRVSAVLVPVATAVVLARLVLAGARWLDRPAVAAASAVLLAGLVAAGLVLTWTRQGFQTDDAELPLLEDVKANKAPGDVYLLPVTVPDLAKTTRGSLSSDFKPLAAKKTDTRIIPVDLQRFRLYTGAAIFVDFKSIPYKDTDVLEWYARLRRNQQFYARLTAAAVTPGDGEGLQLRRGFSAGLLAEVRAELRRHGITHIVTQAHVELPGDGLRLVHADPAYRVYRIEP
jgi:hypothetical protein